MNKEKASKILQAYFLIKTEAGATKDALKKVNGMKNVREAHMFTGPYDIIAIVEADEMDELSRLLLDEIRITNGVKATTTCIRID